MNNKIEQYLDNNEEVLYKYLKKYFGLTTFRPKQLEIIKHTLKGYDSFVSIATGGGKSLCYQLPSLLLKKTTFVISPLKSLISDQTIKLRSLGIKAIKLSSDIKDSSKEYNDIFKGLYRIVFITPERLVNEVMSINKLVENNGVCLFAVDECHCVSQWGTDFRPSYRRLDILRNMFPNVPTMALTATSTTEVENDIIEVLQLQNDNFKIFRSPKNRENIFYKAIYKETENKDYEMILKIINETRKSIGGVSNSTIIYCPTIQTSIDLNQYLQANKILSNCYHSQMSDPQREQVLKQFLFNKTEVVCATIAFGMGIDKHDIRVIIHYGPSKSVEEYYQESGRAGRDGLPSLSLVFFSLQDFTKGSLRINFGGNHQTKSNKIDKLTQLKNIMVNRTECRRKAILSVFNEQYSVPPNGCGGCDNCTEEKDTSNLLELTHESRILINCIFEAGQSCGMKTIINILRGSTSSDLAQKHLKNSYYGKGISFSLKFWKELANQLKTLDYLTETTSNVYTITKFSKKGWELYKSPDLKVFIGSNKILKDEYKLTNFYKNQLSSKKLSTSISISSTISPSKNNIISNKWSVLAAPTSNSNIQSLFQILVEYRKSLSALTEIPEFLLFSEKTLRHIAETRPSSLDSLRLIEGLEEKKIKDHGNSILLKVKEFSKQKSLNLDNFPSNNNKNNNNSNNNNNVNNNNNKITSTISHIPEPPKSQKDKNNISTIFNIIKGFNTSPQSKQKLDANDNNNNNNNTSFQFNVRSSSTGSLNSSSDSINNISKSDSSNNILGEKRKSDLSNTGDNKRFKISVKNLSFAEIYNHKPSLTPINYFDIKNHFKSIRDQSYRNNPKRIPPKQ
ncbi:hypothetical protein DICPUDRAFT_159167 [Dictyostelium purpureum]|uniref:ATP-dependent DNA helicase n=1 Tax=Dictyostelium purpureum TaxID=5786 RepID=F1A3G1_DICPU|nr:uncharacterized protein DICPUDRAFT_159167 [Dictyostelium purpureum]EGC29269.1 hypothetical protein DICPUDRAFT_159167 [Dictyostelium purpureum]|eukprot:XP_003294206.1 hypothetical protein DICPUDRAFT_159167 [Dictyostelium purpureum]